MCWDWRDLDSNLASIASLVYDFELLMFYLDFLIFCIEWTWTEKYLGFLKNVVCVSSIPPLLPNTHSQKSTDLRIGLTAFTTLGWLLNLCKPLCPSLKWESVSCSVVSNSFVTPWTIAHQAPLSIELSRQEYWSRLPFLTQVIFLTHRSNPLLLGLLHWQVDSLTLHHLGSPSEILCVC